MLWPLQVLPSPHAASLSTQRQQNNILFTNHLQLQSNTHLFSCSQSCINVPWAKAEVKFTFSFAVLTDHVWEHVWDGADGSCLMYAGLGMVQLAQTHIQLSCHTQHTDSKVQFSFTIHLQIYFFFILSQMVYTLLPPYNALWYNPISDTTLFFLGSQIIFKRGRQM